MSNSKATSSQIDQNGSPPDPGFPGWASEAWRHQMRRQPVAHQPDSDHACLAGAANLDDVTLLSWTARTRDTSARKRAAPSFKCRGADSEECVHVDEVERAHRQHRLNVTPQRLELDRLRMRRIGCSKTTAQSTLLAQPTDKFVLRCTVTLKELRMAWPAAAGAGAPKVVWKPSKLISGCAVLIRSTRLRAAATSNSECMYDSCRCT